MPPTFSGLLELGLSYDGVAHGWLFGGFWERVGRFLTPEIPQIPVGCSDASDGPALGGQQTLASCEGLKALLEENVGQCEC